MMIMKLQIKLLQNLVGLPKYSPRQIVVLLSTKLDLSQKGFRQVQGVDYNEIFSTVAMLKSVWIMLAIATFYEIWQKDVKIAFFNGFIKEELYMMQPEGFINPKGAKQIVQALAIHQWTGASIPELEYTLWWVDQSI